MKLIIGFALGVLTAGCTTVAPGPYSLRQIPALANYCQDAQRVISRTRIPMQLELHPEFATFIRAKTNIEGPTIHQYNWMDSAGNIQGISCKMKNADHLQLQFGRTAAGPDGVCQDVNRQVYALLQKQRGMPHREVIFDASESSAQGAKISMPGPDWLVPYTMAYLDADETLHVATKGFIIEFSDPRFVKMPATWRGTHYCHFIAPDYLARLMRNEARPGAVIGREVERRINR